MCLQSSGISQFTHYRLPLLALLVVLWSGFAPAPATAQIPPRNVGGSRTLLPIVPLRDPRPSEGAAADQQWQIGRQGADNAPMAGFIGAMTGNDIAVRLVVGQGRLLTTKQPIASEKGTALIAVGDPTIVDFDVLPNPRLIRITGKRAGITDLSITTADGATYSFEVHVTYDLELMTARLQQIFPDTMIKLSQIREHLVVEGQARSPGQVTAIVETLGVYLSSVQVPQTVEGRQSGARTPLGAGGPAGGGAPLPLDEAADPEAAQEPVNQPAAARESGPRPTAGGVFAAPQIINLLRVPGTQQVMLQVKIAELNRTSLREIGADLLGHDTTSGTILGTQIAGASVSAMGEISAMDVMEEMMAPGGLLGTAAGAIGADTTAFGIFPSGDFHVLLRALRMNSVLSILAEPNLVAMSGQEASFLVGGEFPVPVPQGGSVTNNVTIQFKDFGVQLNFVPYVLDNERIRLKVASEVSSIDESLGTTLVAGGDPVPGVNTRRAETTVELRQGQTLAIAGLLQVDLETDTSRIPGLGDLPFIGPLFGNTGHKREEKELLVMVTPYLVEPMEESEVPPLPGTEVVDPTDKEFYFLNRIEGRTPRDFRATLSWDRPFTRAQRIQMEHVHISGPVGFSD